MKKREAIKYLKESAWEFLTEREPRDIIKRMGKDKFMRLSSIDVITALHRVAYIYWTDDLKMSVDEVMRQ